MREIDQAKGVAVRIEPSLQQTQGDTQLYCSDILSRVLHYIDLMIFCTPFFSFQEGKHASDALEAAFVHWGITRGSSAPLSLPERRVALGGTALLQER